MLPIYQREAMWLSFRALSRTALQVGVGRSRAVSGPPWIERLVKDPQNYVALPNQPWLMASTPATVSSASSWPSRLVPAPPSGQVTGQENPRWRNCGRSA